MIMSDLLQTVTGFIDAGGVTMLPLLLCCLAMWYLILRVCLDMLPAAGPNGTVEMTAIFGWFCSGVKQADRKLAQCLARTIHARTRRRLSGAAVLAGIAPLIGLLGTVTGMIDTFDSVARFGMINTKALSMGISQAMISTQTGLVVAVPGLITIYFLRRRAARARRRLEEFGSCMTPKGVAA